MSKDYVYDGGFPLLPVGTYEAQCITYNENFFCKSRKLFLRFKIVESGIHQGKELFMPFNMPFDNQIKTGSKYYKTWVMVNGWRKPSRNAKMSPKLFLSKIYTVGIRTVTPEYYNKKMPEDHWYSVVDRIISVEAG